MEDVDTVSSPMNWADMHWVDIAIHLKAGNIKVFDCYTKMPLMNKQWK